MGVGMGWVWGGRGAVRERLVRRRVIQLTEGLAHELRGTVAPLGHRPQPCPWHIDERAHRLNVAGHARQ